MFVTVVIVEMRTPSLEFERFLKQHTAGKISIEHVNIFLSKYISDGAIDMKLSPDVGNNPNNPHIQINQNIDVHKLSYV